MTILLPALAVGIGAFCMWLTVRIVNRHEKWAIELAISMATIAALVALSISLGTVIYHHARG